MLLLLTLPLAAAVPPASPTSLPLTDRFVYAELDLAQPNLTAVTLSGDLYFYRFDVKDKVYDADDIGQAYTLTNKYAGEASGETFVTDVENAAKEGLSGILAGSFPGASIAGVTASVDRSTLQTHREAPSTRPCASASLRPSSARAPLSASARSAMPRSPRRSPRARSSPPISPQGRRGLPHPLRARGPSTPAGLRFLPGIGVSADGRSLLSDVDNSSGFGIPSWISARLRDPTSTAATEEDIRS